MSKPPGAVQKKPSQRPTKYSDYLHLAELRALHQPRTQQRAEGHFIGLHHVAELLFSREAEELQEAIACLSGRDPDIPAALLCLRRSSAITRQLVSIFALLPELISVAEFQAFRSELGSASGMQSEQFRSLEILSGSQAATTTRSGAPGAQIHPDPLEAQVAAPNLWEAFLYAVGCRGEDVQALRDVLCSGGPGAELADALRTHDLDWVQWRAQHAIMVEAMIGASASGTGGTSGVRYLWSRVGDRFYPILHEATSCVHSGKLL